MLDKTITAISLGVTGIIAITASYIVYMTCGPGGDGIIFGSVAGSVSAIVAGIVGFKLGRSE